MRNWKLPAYLIASSLILGTSSLAQSETPDTSRKPIYTCIDSTSGTWRINTETGQYTYSGRNGYTHSSTIHFDGRGNSLIMIGEKPAWSCKRTPLTMNWRCRGITPGEYAGLRTNLRCYQ